MSLANQPLANSIANSRPPLLLWCSSHSTLAAEELPLLLEAGFRVIPLLTDFWTFEYKPEIDAQLCSDWKATVDLPTEVVAKLQAIKFCADMGQNEFDPNEIALLNEFVDVIYVTVLPNLAMRLAPLFKGTVIFRPFGHGHLNTYTRIAEHLKGDLSTLRDCPNFMWVPILSTLQEPEDPRLCINANQLSAFVSLGRLGAHRWSATESGPYVVETIPRIEKQPYYMEIYKQYREDHRELPLKILGGNSVGGGTLEDAAIVGFLDDEAYYRTAAEARVSVYHGRSRYHVHYHPIEFMALGVPVLFHRDSAFASEGQRYGMSHADLCEAGMYGSVAEANAMARAALDDARLAEGWSLKQRYFVTEVFSRAKALDQARWIRRRTEQLRPWQEKAAQERLRLEAAAPVAAPVTTSPVTDCPTPAAEPARAENIVHHNLVESRKARRPIKDRVVREFKRVWKQATMPSKRAAEQLEQLTVVPVQLNAITEQSQSQCATLQEVSSRVGAACDHLQHMAVDVQVLANRYDQLSDSVTGLQQVVTAQVQLKLQPEVKVEPPSEPAVAQPAVAEPKYKFYGQFTPEVDRFIFERYFPDTGIRGTFIECGAFDGQLECSCKFFEETMGWTGYNLEPSPHIFANLKRNRPQSRNYQVALSNRIGTANFKLVSHPQLGLNYGNGSLTHTDLHTQSLIDGGCTFSEVEVALTTFKAFVENEHINHVDLFVLDVEGHELDVIAGMQASPVLPDILCVEVGHTPLDKVRGPLAALGYVYDISSHVNAFFVHHTKLPLFSFRQACR